MSEPKQMSIEYINRLLAQLPDGVTVYLTFINTEYQFATRGMPGANRRLTNVTTGHEWFLPLKDATVPTHIMIPEFDIKVIN